jgi:hypothetical protein
MLASLLCIPLLSATHALTDEASGSSPSLIVRPNALKTLVNPNCSHCRDEAKRRGKELREADRVLCWIRGYSDGGAIPYRFFLNAYPVISDSYGVFVFDRDAGFARGFAPSYNFRFHGWRNGVMVIRHKDGTLYSALSGLAFDGPGKGSKLKSLPTLVSDWGFWLSRYPQAVAYHMFDKYQATELPAGPNADGLKSRTAPDSRLPDETTVLGVAVDQQAKAYPLNRLEKAGLIQDKLNGKTYVVLWYGPTRTAAAYLPEAVPPRKYSGPQPDANGEPTVREEPPAARRRVTLVRDDKVPAAPFSDQETASRWDIAGRAVEGKLKGWTLTWLDSVQVKWFAWAAEYPQTLLFDK